MKHTNLKQIAVSAALLVAGTSAAFAGSFGPLITPERLQDLIETDAPQILDIRGEAYDAGHIAGAVSAPYGLFRGPADNPGQVPGTEQLETTFESLGLTLDRPVVIVHEGADAGNFGAAARVYWTLKSTGFQNLAILNGGATAWSKAGLPSDTTPVTPQPSELEITFSHEWTADTADVAAIVADGQGATLIDARPKTFYDGYKAHDAAARPGTLPGAINVTYSRWFAPEAGEIGAVADVASLKETLGISGEGDVVSFCNTGHWAAVDWFALSEIAGLDNVKLYPASMVEYSKTDNEMANVPGLMANLWRQISGND